MRILLVGSSGMLGNDCKEVLSQENELITPSRTEMDITSWDEVIETLQTYLPRAVVNCAAYTDVDGCEANDFVVRKTNVEGPRNLAQGCARFGCKLIHISSDYVFDGQKMIPQPYFEDDPPFPLSVYGKTKMESEIAVRENSPDYAIIRSAWLYGINGGNFVKSIIRQSVQKSVKFLRVADDQYGSPTWTYRVAVQIRRLLESGARGTFHATAEGYCTRYECARFILNKLGLKKKIKPCSMNDFQGKAKRPANCILENRMLKQQGINAMVGWEDDLEAFLERFGKEMIKEFKG